MGAEKIGTKRPRRTKEQAAAERADPLKMDTTGWSGKKLASHTIQGLLLSSLLMMQEDRVITVLQRDV